MYSTRPMSVLSKIMERKYNGMKYRRQSTNKKVLNAKTHLYDGILFKSGLEKAAYIKFRDAGLNPKYEQETILLVEGSVLPPNIEVWIPSKSKFIGKKKMKLRDMTYTPDFTFQYKDYKVFVETKGMPNDVYPVKRKLFLEYLGRQTANILFFEPHSLAQIREIINVLKTL